MCNDLLLRLPASSYDKHLLSDAYNFVRLESLRLFFHVRCMPQAEMFCFILFFGKFSQKGSVRIRFKNMLFCTYLKKKSPATFSLTRSSAPLKQGIQIWQGGG